MTVDKKFSPRCFLDVEIDGESAGRIIIELFADVCPITCENFRALCTGEKGLGQTTSKPLHYKGAPFHRVVKNFVIQGGDFVAGNGTGGESIYGGQFKDENFDIPHDKPFLLSMSNRGKDSNGSQFFITTNVAPHLNGKHTVFGEVINGHEVVTKIESIKTDKNCRPVKDVKISNCGELVLKLKQKSKRVTESSSSSESESVKEKSSKRKKKHKHQKKHKKEKKEHKETRTSVREEECTVDPEEIPTIPVNNFLMRRTSPIHRDKRRPSPRENFNYHRPSRSRSGRKIKGRGFMRYRTPSRSTSRSGSETPPHWKQAQARLRNIKDVVLPTRPSPPSDSVLENPEDPAPRNNLLQSRFGYASKSDEDTTNQKDARHILRENRRNREWSPDFSPPPNAKTPRDWSGGSPLRSTVVVTSNFQRDNNDRFNYRRNDRRENFNEHDSRSSRPYDRRQASDSHRNRRERERLPDSNRAAEQPDHELVKSSKDSDMKMKNKEFQSLANELFRIHNSSQYVSEDDSSEEEEEKKKEESPLKSKMDSEEIPSQVSSKYHKDNIPGKEDKELISNKIPFLESSNTSDTFAHKPDPVVSVRKSIIPGICDDSNSNEASMEAETKELEQSSFSEMSAQEQTPKEDQGHPVKERRRWDVQEPAPQSVTVLPDVIPLPEETRPIQEEVSVPMEAEQSRKSFKKNPSPERMSKSEDESPRKFSNREEIRQESSERKARSKSKSPSFRRSASKEKDSSARRRPSPSPPRRASRRRRSTDRRSISPRARRPYSGRRSRSTDRRRSPRRSQIMRYTDLRTRRGPYTRRYSRSPVRNRLGTRRSRSRSPARRRRGRRSSNSSRSSSSGSSGHRKKRTAKRRDRQSSSSSSSSSKSSN
ncbi:peptidyl-prolyl cis-trans isomerase G [Caerostris darwini]|uniref:peptidylprolyl isomerase n=1 Tax=Caerostris darwini TaxID=1538125 RepID=A0AAV4VTD2_9ARAC|nr:peptidyl-prolyl cis-trans isomerase G [Caerostris darwini]